MPHKDLDTEFVLQQADLLRHPGLRRKQRFRSLRNVQAVARHFEYISQLLDVH